MTTSLRWRMSHFAAAVLAGLVVGGAGGRLAFGGPDEMPEGFDARYHRMEGARNYLTYYPAMGQDGTVHAVVEIPSGTTAKR